MPPLYPSAIDSTAFASIFESDWNDPGDTHSNVSLHVMQFEPEPEQQKLKLHHLSTGGEPPHSARAEILSVTACPRRVAEMPSPNSRRCRTETSNVMGIVSSTSACVGDIVGELVGKFVGDAVGD
jgi:hypothetical protein